MMMGKSQMNFLNFMHTILDIKSIKPTGCVFNVIRDFSAFISIFCSDQKGQRTRQLAYCLQSLKS